MASLRLTETRPRLIAGLAAAVVAVAATTALIYPLREVVPAVSTGVTYLVAVLVVSTFWGLRLGLLTALLSALAFNFFHIPPTGRFTIADPENWVALVVFLIAAAIASSLAELARARAAEAEMRRREAALSADMATLLLAGGAPGAALTEVAGRVGSALGIDWARIQPGSGIVESSDEEIVVPLLIGEVRIASLIVPADADPAQLEQARGRVAPALATLVAASLERDRLGAEAIEARALRRSDELKTALLRSVSHDLRTPLTSIVAAGEALGSSTITSAERAELAEAVTGEASRLSHLVDQLLDLSRLEAGAAEPRRDWCSIEEIARAAAEQADSGAGFRFSFEDPLPLVNLDAGQLERVLVNVLENAARHSAGSPPAVGVRRVGSKLVIRVVDQGPGVRASELERIFEPFYQGEAGRSGAHRGSGLGLAIARGFVEANGGTIRAESLPAQGTAIVIDLPIEALPAVTVPSSPRPAPAAS